MQIECGNDAALRFPDGCFDLVLQFTVFTSVLDSKLKRKMGAEMVRVLKPDGLIVWYDFHTNNPWNPDVRGVKKQEIIRLFPSCTVKLQRLRLAPPMARLVAPYTRGWRVSCWKPYHFFAPIIWVLSQKRESVLQIFATMMKIATIVGARPQFIKYAPVAGELSEVAANVLIHTGQHYDDNMSEVFFRGLDLPQPDYNLGVGSGTHGEQSGEMLKRIEKVLLAEEPDYVLVFGDTNSTLAGALAAAKLHIPVGHIEAGLRSFNRRMPEEINRVVTDHLSSLLFCPTETSVGNLAREGITEGVHLVGDVMYDALLLNARRAEEKSRILEQRRLQPKSYFLATVHCAENTDDPSRLAAIVKAFEMISDIFRIVWPVHPRTRKVLESYGWQKNGGSFSILDPVSYLDLLCLEKGARGILTDSGGVQKEAYWLGVPCITLRGESEWVETLQSGWNTLVGTDSEAIFAAATKPSPSAPCLNNLFGDGHSGTKIVHALLDN